MVKKKRTNKYTWVWLVVLIVITLGVFYFSTQQTALPDTSDVITINDNIMSTSITKISETDTITTVRFTWKTNGSSESNCAVRKSLDLKFTISDFESKDTKPILTNIDDTFNIQSSNITLTNLKALKNPCESDKQEVVVTGLITSKNAVCNMIVDENNKPIISCSAEIEIDSSEGLNYYGSVDGYVDLKLNKEIA